MPTRTAPLPCERPSPEAVSAAHDTVFEALEQTAALAESYARSLGEAAWRGDRVTAETHLRQLRASVLAAIDILKQLREIEPEGGET